MTPTEYQKYLLWVGQQDNPIGKFGSEQALRSYYISNVLTKNETAIGRKTNLSGANMVKIVPQQSDLFREKDTKKV